MSRICAAAISSRGIVALIVPVIANVPGEVVSVLPSLFGRDR